MARKQSSKIYFNGNYHNEIYFNGNYHDKAYIVDSFGDVELVWEKLSGLFYGYIDWQYSTICNFKNNIYANARIYILSSSGSKVIKDYNCVCKFNFNQNMWYVMHKNCISGVKYTATAYSGKAGILLQTGNTPKAVVDYKGNLKTVKNSDFMINTVFTESSTDYYGIQTKFGTIVGRTYTINTSGISLVNYNYPTNTTIKVYNELNGYKLRCFTCFNDKIYAVGFKQVKQPDGSTLNYKTSFIINFNGSEFSYEQGAEITWTGNNEPDPKIWVRTGKVAFNNGNDYLFTTTRNSNYEPIYFKENFGILEEYSGMNFILAKDNINIAWIKYTTYSSTLKRLSNLYINGTEIALQSNPQFPNNIVETIAIGGTIQKRGKYVEIDKYKIGYDGTVEELGKETDE